MFALARVQLPAPVSLILPVTRLRIVPGSGPAPGGGAPRTLSGFDACFTVNPTTRTIHAEMPPLPRALLIYGPADFAAACADTPEQHATRVIEILGGDPRAYLQSIIDGTAPTSPPARVARTVSKLALRRNLRAAGMESALDAYLAANPQAKADWDDSQLLDLRDPLLAESLPAFALAAGVTESQILAILQSSQDTP